MLYALAARGRITNALLVLAVIAGVFNAMPARAVTSGTASPTLSTPVDFSGTGSLVTKVRTTELRSATPTAGAPRILVIGTGVQRDLFPAELQSSITGINGASDFTDTHGYGTLATSTILQLQPNAIVKVYKVRSHDNAFDMARLDDLAAALKYARTNAKNFDAVLLAYPPQAALDPVSYVIGHVDHGAFGKGMNLVVEAMLSTRQTSSGPVAGIPADKALRDAMFARANLRQRDAVERFATQAAGYQSLLSELKALDAAGISVVAPSGDYARKQNNAIVALPAQTVFGLSAIPSVITVGASYTDGSTTRLSPTSGRGPTLGLEAKPDLLAPAEMFGLLPGRSALPWQDDSTRVPLAMLQWARAGVAPTPCPSITNVYRCVLQGSSMISASLVAANIAGQVTRGVPNTASARSSLDDDVLRGMAWAAASANGTRAFGADRPSFPWEQGTGSITGLKDFSAVTTPVALKPATLGEIAPGKGATTAIPFWKSGAQPMTALPSITSFIGPDESGQARTSTANDDGRLETTIGSAVVELTAGPAKHIGGFWAGGLGVAGPTGVPTTIPLSYVQAVSLDFHASYAVNEYLGNEGERVEDATLLLFPGLPTGVGLIGDAFKNLTGKSFRGVGGDPTNGMIIRAGRAANTFTTPGLKPIDHGRGTVEAVPPGFYRLHLLSDHTIEAEQPRGHRESIGMQLATSGPDAAVIPGSNVLVPSTPVCGQGQSGPMDGCVSRSGANVDPSSGLCIATNSGAQVGFHYYCGEMAYAVPTGLASRAIHQIAHDPDPTKSEWAMCGVNVPLDGSGIDIAKITTQARSCQGTTAPSSWAFNPRAPECLGASEKASAPGGMTQDVTATYTGLNTATLRNLPVGVMTYQFKLPELNTYTTAGLSLSYVAENAIVAVRFQTGPDTSGDASNSILAINDSRVNVTPSLPLAAKQGTIYNEWAVMSSNAPTGTLSLIVIPTALTRSDLNPTAPIAKVQLCDVALKVLTFAKGPYEQVGAPNRFMRAFTDRGLLSQIKPTNSRVRATWNGSSFKDLGAEREDLTFALQIPKNSTTASGAQHRVRSPWGGPAHMTGVVGSSGANVFQASQKTYDPAYGTTDLSCVTGGEAPPMANFDKDRPTGDTLCRAWQAARDSGKVLLQVAPDSLVNGRFAGLLMLDHATLTRAAGITGTTISATDDGGAFDAAGRWATREGRFVRRLPVGDYYDELPPMTFGSLGGIISTTKDAAGNVTLRLTTGGPGGATRLVTAALGR